MMQTLVLALLLASILAFLLAAVRHRVCAALHRRRPLVWAVPLCLTAIFTAAAFLAGVPSLWLTALVLAYTLLPTAAVFKGWDFTAVLLLWLPLEFGAGGNLVPRAAQGFLHSVAYGIAILLGLVLFLGFRKLPAMKYNLPHDWRDLWRPLLGFAIVAPVLILVGIAIGFIPPPHLPVQSAGRMAAAAPLIFAATALPEEILFRALIQNILMQRLGESTRTLVLASVIFGAAHLDNGPQALPNWRYMILATIAGVAYGKVFQKSSTVLSSAGLHMAVDWTKHFFF